MILRANDSRLIRLRQPKMGGPVMVALLKENERFSEKVWDVDKEICIQPQELTAFLLPKLGLVDEAGGVNDQD